MLSAYSPPFVTIACPLYPPNLYYFSTQPYSSVQAGTVGNMVRLSLSPYPSLLDGFLWISQDTVPQIVVDVFNLPSLCKVGLPFELPYWFC